MTDEDKQLIAGYMGWAQYKYPPYYLNIKGDIESHHFDLNDAGVCVQEMQKRGEWVEFFYFIWNRYRKSEKLLYKEVDEVKFTTLLFNAENFFGAMAAWLKEGKK